MNCDDLKQFDIVVDVRSPAEHQQSRIKGSKLMPMSELHLHINELAQFDKVAIYCRSGQRSNAVVQYLNSRGHAATNIGGINQFLGCLEY